MSPVVLGAVIGANVLGISMALPQAVRLARTRRVDGVSAAWAGISASMNAWWVAYGVATDHWAIVPASVIPTVVYSVIGVLLVRERPAARPALLATAGVALLVPGVVLVGGGWTMTGLTLGWAYAVQLLPAALTAWRSGSVAGIATGTWVIAASEASLWVVYGSADGDPGILAFGAAGLVMSGTVLARLALGERPARRSPTLAPA